MEERIETLEEQVYGEYDSEWLKTTYATIDMYNETVSTLALIQCEIDSLKGSLEQTKEELRTQIETNITEVMDLTVLNEKAYAKINLTLDVLQKRDDGYHDLKSVMQTVSIRDDVEIDVGTGEPWKLECSTDGIPTDRRNLAWKAAKVFLKN